MGGMVGLVNLKSEDAQELAELLYQLLLEKGEIDLNGVEERKTLDSDSTYGLRRISSGAIQILNDKDDVQHLKDEKGYSTYIYRLI